jgi:alkylation response protein AidB-like acyl-CoA dehydrogenase
MRAAEITLSADQEALRASIAGFLASTRRAVADPGEDDAARTWRRIASELELTGLGTPETLGGSGTWLEVCVALEEMGHASYPGPYLSTVGLAQSLLLALVPSVDRDRLVAAIATGELVASLAPTVVYGAGTTELVARETPTGWTVSGEAGSVLDGGQAGVMLAVIAVGDGLSVFAIDPRSSGSTVKEAESLDIMRSVAAVSLSDVAATLLAADVPATALDLATARSQAALACEAAGGMQACLEETVAYIQQRRQFGRVIGSFQALKHMAAEMLVTVESARALAYEAAETVAGPADELDWLVVSAAKAFTAEAYAQVAGEAIQLHGAIGFTWEQGVHRFYRRALATRALLGGPHEHRDKIARALMTSDIAAAAA